MPQTSSARELGYQPVEINASDTRNKADSKITGGMGGKLANAVKEMCTNTAIGQDERGQRKRVPYSIYAYSTAFLSLLLSSEKMSLEASQGFILACHMHSMSRSYLS